MSGGISEEEILDFAARIGVRAKLDGMKKAQIENLLASLDLAADSKNSLWVTTVYAYRQAARLGGGRWRTPDLIHEAMVRLHEAGCGKDEARKLLGFAKWVYECVEKRYIRRPDDIRKFTLKELLVMLRGS